MTKIGSSTLYNTDCMELMAQYPDKHFDLAIVDVPYGIGESNKNFNSRHRPCEKWKNPKLSVYEKKEWDNKTVDQNYIKNLFRVSKNQIIWGANHFISLIPIDSPCWIVWDKKTGDNDFADCELAWTSFDTAVRKFDWLWSGFKKQKPETRIHPTQKPIALYKWLLSKYAKPNDKILDTHFGSGSIAIACNEMGFNLTASEIDADYFQAACDRIREANRQGDLFREAV